MSESFHYSRKKLLVVVICLCMSVLLICLLYLISDKINRRANGFIRLFPPSRIIPGNTLDIGYNSYYIAGIAQQHIYLGNFTAPAHLLVSDNILSDTQHLQLDAGDNTTIKQGGIVTVDSPFIYYMNGADLRILSGTMPFPLLSPATDSIPFFDAVPVSPGTFMLKIYNATLHQSVLTKHGGNNMPAHRQPHILEKQVDGLFCTDGMLQYDPATARLVYVYFYRNQFVCLDTNLNVLYKGKTIDTTSRAKIKLSTKAGVTTMAVPPLTVNKQSCIAAGWLFIHSKLRANNEDRALFDKCSVIDVYAVKDGRYAFSFYIPDYDNKKVSSFKVFNKMLVVIQDRYLSIYYLNF